MMVPLFHGPVYHDDIEVLVQDAYAILHAVENHV